ncbi:MAG: hypothetical protein ABI780_03225 [Ardenticatenales bacterium]
MARKTPQRPRTPQPARRPDASPSAAGRPAARPPRAPRAPAVANMVAADYEADLTERYRHVRRDLMRIAVIGTLLFALIIGAHFFAAQSGGQLFFTF